MAHPLGEVALLVARGGSAPDATLLGQLEDELSRRDISHHRVPLLSPDAARAEVALGTRLLVVCGGQRAFRSVVDDLRSAGGTAEDTVVGVFPAGRAHDFAKSFGLDVNPRAAASLMASDRIMRVDLGRATVAARDGSTQTHLVVNDAVVGLGAAVARRAARLGRVPRVGPLAAWWSSLATYRPRPLDVDMTFAEWHDTAVQVRIANGQFAHDGLHMSPLALPDDGAWDVQVWDGPVHLPFTLQPKMVLGEHLPHEHIAQWRQKRVEVTARKATPVAVDGHYVGTTPAVFELEPGALRLKI